MEYEYIRLDKCLKIRGNAICNTFGFVAEAVGKYLVVYGVLQIRRNNNNIGNNHTLKRGTTMTTMNGVGGGYCNIPFLLRTT